MEYQHIQNVWQELKQTNRIARGFDPELNIWLYESIRDIEREINRG